MTASSRTILAAALALAAALPAWGGVHYKAVTRTETASRSGDIQVEAWISADKARVEFVKSQNPTARAGTWLLTRDGGRKIYLVDPEQKAYGEWDVEAMLGLMGGLMQGLGPLLKIEFSEPKVEKLLEEDGGKVAGLPTRHYRYRTTYTTKVKVFGMGRATDNVSEQDMWVTDRLKDPGLGVWLRPATLHTGNPDFDRQIAALAVSYNGFPLKMTAVTTSTQQKGGQQTVTRTSREVTELDMPAVPDSRFEIPAGYEEKPMMPVTPGGRGGTGR